ncbi:4616_t:CDS:2 [Scutellospora calospora]|uniref:4616_t:CDS:1 n=1 Tax=Scutellospora calospora TaxID=85575 RepID=A0ACA9L4U9_9GLOM|nr:4616_t:CDS:2 [Scutellospora calospora]
MKFINLFAYTALVALISFHSAEAQTPTTPTPTSPASPASPPYSCPTADLPTFSYNLCNETGPDRTALCSRNMGYCTNNCAGSNFCNNETMAWGCGCSNKVPDFNAYQWPINYADCQGRGQACMKACKSEAKCIQACSTCYSNVCGTPNQPPAYYQTDDVSQTPSYGPPTNTSTGSGSGSGSPNASGTSSASGTNSAKSGASSLSITFSIGSAISALAVVAAGMMML